MKRLQDLPIRRRVTMVILLMFCFVLLLSGVGLWLYQTITFQQRSTAEVRTCAQLLSAALDAPVSFNDREDARNILERLLTTAPDIDEIHVFKGTEATPFVSLPDSRTPPAGYAPTNELVRFEPSGLWLIAELRSEPRGEGRSVVFAHIALHSNMRTLELERSRSVAVLGAVLAVMLGLSLAFGGFLKRSLTDPLSALTLTIHEIAEKKDRALRAPRLSDDEIGSLATDFNRMLEALEKQSEELRASEERYRLLTENSTNFIWELDGDMQFRYASPNVRNLGYEPSELVGHVCREFVHPEDWTKAEPKLQNTSSSAIYRFRRKDGFWCWLESSTQTYTTSNSEPRRVVVSRDITDRMKSEEDKAKLEAQLRQAQKMEAIGTLAGGIAHDFNNILGSIIPYTQLAMEDSKGNPEVVESLQEVLKAADRAKSLVQQILAFSRKQPQQDSVIRLQSLVKEALKLIRSALPSSIEIVTDIADDVPPVMADPVQMHQVLMNLCTNAAQAMKNRPGQLKVTLSEFPIEPDSAAQFPELLPGRHVKLSVTDTGHGMTPELMKRIFDPFFTTKAPGEGTGLGLSVVHGIIKAYRGAIHVYSRVGEGTTFHIYLPASSTASDTSFLIGDPAEPLPAGQGQHVLFVDDESGICVTARRILERLGYRVTTFTDPETALQNFRTQPSQFDLLITDLTMPKMSGLNLATEVTRLRPGIPMILTSGYLGLTNTADVRRAGIREVMTKPVSAGLYAETLHRILHPVVPSRPPTIRS